MVSKSLQRLRQKGAIRFVRRLWTAGDVLPKESEYDKGRREEREAAVAFLRSAGAEGLADAIAAGTHQKPGAEREQAPTQK